MDITDTTPPTGAPATAPAPQAVTFTPEQQEQVNRIAAAARAEGKSSAERATLPAAPPPAEKPGKVTPESVQAELETMRLRIAYERRASKAGIPEDTLDDTFDLYRSKPADQRDTWLEGWSKKFMPTTPASTSNPAPAAAGVEAVKPAAAPNAPGRVDPITAGGLVDIWNLRDDEIAQLGPQGMREQFEKLLAAGNKAAGAPPRPKTPQR